MSRWLDLSNNANLLKQTYVRGFVDISGGGITTRGTADKLVIGGDTSLNGTGYLGNQVFVKSDGLIIPGTATNGAVPYYLPDIPGTSSNGATMKDVAVSYDASWTQMGANILQETINDAFGYEQSTLALSSDGKTIAIGAGTNQQYNRISYTRVFKYTTITDSNWNNYNRTNAFYTGVAPNNQSIVLGATSDTSPVPGKYYWVQKGVDIDGEATYDEAGSSVSLSADGNIVVIGSQFNDGLNTTVLTDNRGSVRAYQYRTIAETNWTNYNSSNTTFTGVSPNNKPVVIGASVDTVPVSGKYYWVQMGGDIVGERGGNESQSIYGDRSGQDVKLSSDGTTVAITSINSWGTNATASLAAGHTRVYKYMTVSSWTGYNTTNLLYDNANISPILITGGDATWTSGKYYWVQQGGDIDGEESARPVAVSLNANGTIVAMGAQGAKGADPANSTTGSGHVRVYQYRPVSLTEWSNYNRLTRTNNNNSPQPILITGGDTVWNSTKSYWVQLGADIDGDYNYMGSAVSLSSDGYTVGVCGIRGGYFAGHARVFKYQTLTDSNWNNYRFTTNVPGNYNISLNPIVVGASGDSIPVQNKYYWVQMGRDIVGENSPTYNDELTTIALSANGTIIALGCSANSGTNTNTSMGMIRMFQYRTVSQIEWDQLDNSLNLLYNVNNTKPILLKWGDTTWNANTKYWVQMGGDIDGTIGGGSFGRSVAMSADGTIVAGSQPANSAACNVRVYNIPATITYYDICGGIAGYNNIKTTAALCVSGATDISGNSSLRGNVSIGTSTTSANLFVSGDCSINGNLRANRYSANSMNINAIFSTADVSFTNRLFVARPDISLNYSRLRVAPDLSSANTTTALGARLTVPANITIVDGSNGTVYGSYLSLTNKNASNFYNVGKSASGIFNIVNQNNAGVYITSGGTSFTGTSDARLKTNIVPLSTATDKIMALKPCTYQWKADVESASDPTAVNTHVGFIAQEVEAVMPELVHPINHPAGPDYKSVNTTDMIPYLVRMIQENRVKIDTLRKEIEEILHI